MNRVGRRALRALGAALVTLVGTAMVFLALVVMNQFVERPEGGRTSTVVNFSVPPPTPEPPPRRQQTPQRQPSLSNQPAIAPVPNVGTNLSTITVAQPGFTPEPVSNVAESLLGDVDNVALTEDAVDDPPSLRTSSIEYPDRARQRDIEGSVRVTVLVGTDGRVKKLQILEANPPGVFEDAVREAVPNWTFNPARYRGRPVEAWVTIPIPFRLN